MARNTKYSRQKDGRYHTSVTIGTRPDGTKLIKHPSGKTIKELDDKVAELKRRYIAADAEVDRDVLVMTYLLNWYETEKKPNLEKSSRQNYCTVINGYILPAIGQRRMAAITYADLQEIIGTRMKGLGKTMIGDAHSILTNVFALASATGVIDRDPSGALKKPKTESKSRRELTDDETSAALRVGAEHPYGLLLLILFYTGCRRGEALGLRWSDIDFPNRTIHIERDIDFTTADVGDVKTTESVRDVPLPDGLYAALDAVRGIGNNYVIMSPKTKSFLPQSTYVRHFQELRVAMLEACPTIEKELLNETSLKKNKKRSKDKQVDPIYGSVITAHYFRHNYASILYDSGVDVMTAQRYLGHTDPATTLRIYTHLKKTREKKGAKKVIAAFKGISSR